MRIRFELYDEMKRSLKCNESFKSRAKRVRMVTDPDNDDDNEFNDSDNGKCFIFHYLNQLSLIKFKQNFERKRSRGQLYVECQLVRCLIKLDV